MENHAPNRARQRKRLDERRFAWGRLAPDALGRHRAGELPQGLALKADVFMGIGRRMVMHQRHQLRKEQQAG